MFFRLKRQGMLDAKSMSREAGPLSRDARRAASAVPTPIHQ
ncbi:hypothetical protein K788_0000089 [Paraburkholderia caribensis MBA4]|uniref:Uncharacterized protein n=1 Tax=Paraburkholderia caribensis MBA4 TaxID=1323664 RepID=A0A0P0RJE7_9BURK|nr:hypothetical protein K788_0000089 [Paraburkholderia caribensis MBA4]